jgi:hypothetical protein
MGTDIKRGGNNMTTPYETWLASQPIPVAVPEENIKKLAYVIDGKVVQTLSTDERMWAIILSDPTIVDITDITFPDITHPDGSIDQVVIKQDWSYDGTTFTPPVA